ncbi:MAG: sulfate adenylyltransferase subunit CysN [Victivallaceae bacterium]|nr:sulfate adenylyltransferase subunit CysN [Victivallaceae bacterium]
MSIDIEKFIAENAKKDLLRFTTAGSVDDGKSTLIGRLLHDAKAIYEDQIVALKNDTQMEQMEIDFALLTDGLMAEREQGITIDVAYRYFSTPKRKFIIADTPGHEQYTRNMATGASTANLAIILIDARAGVKPQSKRHSYIASLLGISHFIVAVNKMDLVDYDEQVFDAIKAEYRQFAKKMGRIYIDFVPISALKGDNVVQSGGNMDWYRGSTVMEFLESSYISSGANLTDFRFPVQYIIDSTSDHIGYCGQIVSGVVKKGDMITVLPAKTSAKIRSIETFDGELDYAFAPQSVMLTLDSDIAVKRGDMLVHQTNIPVSSKKFSATVVWMDQAPIKANQSYLIKHTTNIIPVQVDNIQYKMNVNDLQEVSANELKLNEIGKIDFNVPVPLYFDNYSNNSGIGCFILIDPENNNTVGAGMINS